MSVLELNTGGVLSLPLDGGRLLSGQGLKTPFPPWLAVGDACLLAGYSRAGRFSHVRGSCGPDGAPARRCSPQDEH